VTVAWLPARRAGLEFVERLLKRHPKDRELSGLGAAVSGRVGEVQAGVPVTEVAERHL
jgi:hypothetical protein